LSIPTQPVRAQREFDAPFPRLDQVEESLDKTRFDVMGHRHTGTVVSPA
jgi:hypothetical protein